MRIAQIAPLTEAIPPKLYGGTERVIYWLTEELVALGHDVTLFASGNSRTSAKLVPVWPKALRLDGAVRDACALHMTMLEQVRRQAADFDFLHFHLDYYPFSLFCRQSTTVPDHAARTPRPTGAPAGVHDLLVGSGCFDFRRAAATGAASRLGPNNPSWPAGAAFDPAAGASPAISRALAASRRKRRFDRAIRIAERCGLPLKIAAKVDKVDRDYFEERFVRCSPCRTSNTSARSRDSEKAAYPQRRHRPAGADRLAGAVRPGDDRGDGLRHARHRLQSRRRAGGHREWIDRLHRRRRNQRGRGRRSGRLSSRAINIRRRFEQRFTARRMAKDYLAVYRGADRAAEPRPRLVARSKAAGDGTCIDAERSPSTHPRPAGSRAAAARPGPSRRPRWTQGPRTRRCCRNDRSYSRRAWCSAQRRCRPRCRRCRSAEIEPPRAAHDVGDDERKQHAENGGARPRRAPARRRSDRDR